MAIVLARINVFVSWFLSRVWVRFLILFRSHLCSRDAYCLVNNTEHNRAKIWLKSTTQNSLWVVCCDPANSRRAQISFHDTLTHTRIERERKKDLWRAVRYFSCHDQAQHSFKCKKQLDKCQFLKKRTFFKLFVFFAILYSISLPWSD